MPLRGRRSGLLGLWLLVSAAAQADLPNWSALPPAPECAAEPASGQVGELQYMPAWRTLLAWRHWQSAGVRCVRLDWPRAQALTSAQAAELDAELARMDALWRATWTPALPRAYTEAAAYRPAPPDWAATDWVHAPMPTRTLPLCPRVPSLVQMRTVELPPALAATVLRVRPLRCLAGSLPMAGSGVLLAPDLALTAAHVVMTRDGLVCDRYRVTPGGRRYSDPPTAPYGAGVVTRAVLSERGGWHVAAGAAPPPDRDYGARTAHDYSILLLETPAQLPSDTLWPRLRFGAAPGAIGTPVLMAGYAARMPQGRAAPGALVSVFGQLGCPRGVESPVRAALWMSPGGSGGPIWNWAAEQALQLETLSVRLEVLAGERYEALGPRFDLKDYAWWLQQLPALPSAGQTRR